MSYVVKGGASLSGSEFLRDILRQLDTSWFSEIRIAATPGLLGPPPDIILRATKILSDGYTMESTQPVLSFTKEDLPKAIKKALNQAKEDLIQQGASA